MAYKSISPKPVAEGGTGAKSFTAYAPICGGTTSTGGLQSTASAGTSGQVLISQGGSALPAFTTFNQVSKATLTLTSTQIKSIFGTPISILSNPGAGLFYMIAGYSLSMVYGSNPFTAGGGQTLQVTWGNPSGSVQPIATVFTNGGLNASQNEISYGIYSTSGGVNSSLIVNAPVYIWNPSTIEITGNASNDTVIHVKLYYYTVTL